MAKNESKNNSGIRKERNEHLTNWYMINLSFGVLGIILLLFFKNGYNNMSLLPYMNTFSWILTAIFALGAVVVFILGKSNVIKNVKRAGHYSILLIVCALVMLWLALYNDLRPLIESIARTIFNNPNLAVYSYWNVRIPIIGICAYLIIAFVGYVIAISKK